ncbi:MAG: hypothetical protein AB7H71_15765 [Alphaproteobacteria bacterium]
MLAVFLLRNLPSGAAKPARRKESRARLLLFSCRNSKTLLAAEHSGRLRRETHPEAAPTGRGVLPLVDKLLQIRDHRRAMTREQGRYTAIIDPVLALAGKLPGGASRSPVWPPR